ncbi:hypothetical protein DPMN_067169 [Dreissena polymorpha]|uniref:Uncharacterized protein n=1 Tax=Dreissena polymorpha TaxID=45954 RepID=A0A9D3YZ85_DREPO|nr:hypothetical protein DPMN_067169 [Dreissena polymorpha]
MGGEWKWGGGCVLLRSELLWGLCCVERGVGVEWGGVGLRLVRRGDGVGMESGLCGVVRGVEVRGVVWGLKRSGRGLCEVGRGMGSECGVGYVGLGTEWVEVV